MDTHADKAHTAAAGTATLKKPQKLVQKLTSVLSKLKLSKSADRNKAAKAGSSKQPDTNATVLVSNQHYAGSATSPTSTNGRHTAGSGDATTQWGPRSPIAGGASAYWHSHGSHDSDWDMQGGLGSSQANELCLTAGSTGLQHQNSKDNSREESKHAAEGSISQAVSRFHAVEAAGQNLWPEAPDTQASSIAWNQPATRQGTNSAAPKSTSTGVWTAQAAGTFVKESTSSSRTQAQQPQVQQGQGTSSGSIDVQWPTSAPVQGAHHLPVGSNSLSQWVTTPAGGTSANVSSPTQQPQAGAGSRQGERVGESRAKANSLYTPLPDFAAATQSSSTSKALGARMSEDLTRKIALIQEQVAKLTDEELLDPRTTSRLQVLSTHASGNTPELVSDTHSGVRNTAASIREVPDHDGYGEQYEDGYGVSMEAEGEIYGDSRGWGIVLDGPVPDLDIHQDAGWLEQQQQLLLQGQGPTQAENGNPDDSGFLARLQASMSPPPGWSHPSHVQFHGAGLPGPHPRELTAPNNRVAGDVSSQSMPLPAVSLQRSQLGAMLAARAGSGVPVMDMMAVTTQGAAGDMYEIRSSAQVYNVVAQQVTSAEGDLNIVGAPGSHPQRNVQFMLAHSADTPEKQAVISAGNAISDMALQQYTGVRMVPSGPISSGDPMLLPPPPAAPATASPIAQMPNVTPLDSKASTTQQSASVSVYNTRLGDGLLPDGNPFNQLLTASKQPVQQGGEASRSAAGTKDAVPAEALAATGMSQADTLFARPTRHIAVDGGDVMVDDPVGTPAGPHELLHTGSSYTLAAMSSRAGGDSVPRTPTVMSTMQAGGARLGSASDASIRLRSFAQQQQAGHQQQALPPQPQQRPLAARGSFLPSPFAPMSAGNNAHNAAAAPIAVAGTVGDAVASTTVSATLQEGSKDEAWEAHVKVVAAAAAGPGPPIAAGVLSLVRPGRTGSSSSVSDASARFSITAALDRYKQQVDSNSKNSSNTLLAGIRAVSATITSGPAVASQHSTHSSQALNVIAADSASNSEALAMGKERDSGAFPRAVNKGQGIQGPAGNSSTGLPAALAAQAAAVTEPGAQSISIEQAAGNASQGEPAPIPLKDMPPNPFDAALRNSNNVLIVRPLPQAVVSPRLRRSSSPVPQRPQEGATSVSAIAASPAGPAAAHQHGLASSATAAAPTTQPEPVTTVTTVTIGKPQSSADRLADRLTDRQQMLAGMLRLEDFNGGRIPSIPEDSSVLRPSGAPLRRRASSGLLRAHAMYANGMRAAATKSSLLRPQSHSNIRLPTLSGSYALPATPSALTASALQTRQQQLSQAPVVRPAPRTAPDELGNGDASGTGTASLSGQNEEQVLGSTSAASCHAGNAAPASNLARTASLGSSTSRLGRLNSLGAQDTAAIVAAAAGLSSSSLLPQPQQLSSTVGTSSLSSQQKRASTPASSPLPEHIEAAGDGATARPKSEQGEAGPPANTWPHAWQQRGEPEHGRDSDSLAGQSRDSAAGPLASPDWAQPRTPKARGNPPAPGASASALFSQSITSMRWSASSGRNSRTSLQQDAAPSPSVPSHLMDSRSSEVQLLLTTLATLGYDTTNPQGRQRVRSLLLELPKQQPLQQQFIQSLEWGTHQTQMASDASNLSRLFDSRAAYVPSYQLQNAGGALDQLASQMQNVLPYVAPSTPHGESGTSVVGGDSGVPTMVTDEFGMLVPVPVLATPEHAQVHTLPHAPQRRASLGRKEEVVPSMVRDESGMLVHVPQRGSLASENHTPMPRNNLASAAVRDEVFSGYFSSPRKAPLEEEAVQEMEAAATRTAMAAVQATRSSHSSDGLVKQPATLPPQPAAPPAPAPTSHLTWPVDRSQSIAADVVVAAAAAAVAAGAASAAPSSGLRGDLRLRAITRSFETASGSQAPPAPGSGGHTDAAPSSEVSMSGGLAPALSGGSGSGGHLAQLQGHGLQLALVVLGGSLVLLNLVAMVAMLLMMRSMGSSQ